MADEAPAVARAWRRWRGLTPGERRLALQASLLLPLMGLALRAAGFKRVRRWALNGSTFNVPTFQRSNAEPPAERVAEVVDWVARAHPCRPTCLTRSLALAWMLRRSGIAAELRIGVRLDGDRQDTEVDFEASTSARTKGSRSRLRAHAWVEHDGRALGETREFGDCFVAF
jgi:hypothetical protein